MDWETIFYRTVGAIAIIAALAKIENWRRQRR
jgi:hypothetical protein